MDLRYGQASFRVLDLACGNGSVWPAFLSSHPAVRVIGVDTDAEAIRSGQKTFSGNTQIDLRVFDAQHPLPDGSFDVVVALSAMEHVVDHPAFLKTAWTALKSGGIAYLNYDVGHFRSHDWKERLMVPVSQLLARVGIEGPYMKQVDDARFRVQAERQGFTVEGLRKHNLHALKKFMKGASDQAVHDWYAFEERLGQQFPPEQLDGLLWSSTFILKRP